MKIPIIKNTKFYSCSEKIGLHKFIKLGKNQGQ